MEARRIARHGILCAIACAAIAGCCRIRQPEKNVSVVAAPISGRANTILTNLIDECPIVNGQWRHDMGCTAASSAAFGYEVGSRRGRDDILKIGQVSAENESSKMKRALWQYLFGQTPDFSDLNGSPACFYSGVYGRNGLDYWMFSKLTDTIAKNPDNYKLNDVQIAGSVYFLANMAMLEEKNKAFRLQRARYLASKTANGQIPFIAFAYASIAKVTKDPNDIKLAKETTEKAIRLYFEPNNPNVKVAVPYAECLSWYNATINACADMAVLEPRGPWQDYAISLLDYIFSDKYFNGKFLVHDLCENGKQADYFCAGCNFAVVYLADRLYGDSLKINPLKSPKVLHLDVKILHAEYGANGKFIDVTKQLQKLVRNDRLNIQVTNDIGGDPLPKVAKTLYLECKIGKQTFKATAPEYSWVSLP